MAKSTLPGTVEEFTLGDWRWTAGERIPCVKALVTRHRTNSFIYCIRRPDTGSVKVGRAWNVLSRLQTIQTSNDVELELAFYFRCIDAAEAYIHEMLAPWRLRGEWFAPSPEVLDWVTRQSFQPNVKRSLAPADRVVGLRNPPLRFAAPGLHGSNDA